MKIPRRESLIHRGRQARPPMRHSPLFGEEKPAWTKEVDKMVKWGAVVEPQDHDALVEYLSSNFPVDKAAFIAERSRGPASTSKK